MVANTQQHKSPPDDNPTISLTESEQESEGSFEPFTTSARAGVIPPTNFHIVLHRQTSTVEAEPIYENPQALPHAATGLGHSASFDAELANQFGRMGMSGDARVSNRSTAHLLSNFPPHTQFGAQSGVEEIPFPHPGTSVVDRTASFDAVLAQQMAGVELGNRQNTSFLSNTRVSCSVHPYDPPSLPIGNPSHTSACACGKKGTFVPCHFPGTLAIVCGISHPSGGAIFHSFVYEWKQCVSCY